MNEIKGVIIVSFLLILGFFISYKYNNGFESVNYEGIVYQSKTCSCCKKWVEHLSLNGFIIKSVMVDNVLDTKVKLGVPAKLSSCHTALINGYLIEGHVPASAIRKMLTSIPKIKGLAVPGMPMGSPGMEGSYKDAYDVISFNEDDSQNIFMSFNSSTKGI